jgi:non-specific serine/threonine protein kinase
VLPTVGGAPGPSPELVRDAVPPTGSVTRTPWRVPCVRWDAPDAAALLAAGPPEGCTTGASWRHAAELAAFADDLAARGRVLPVVEPLDPVPDGVPARGPTRTVRAAARWRPLVTGADAAWARALVLALPPVALHGAADVGGPGRGGGPPWSTTSPTPPSGAGWPGAAACPARPGCAAGHRHCACGSGR